MQSFNRRTTIGLLASAAAWPVGRSAEAEADKPRALRIIVPYPPGGPTDVLARLLARDLAERRSGRTVVVENKPGASGALGTREAAKAPADGSTLVLGTNQTHVTNAMLLKDPGYDPIRDFTPLALLAGLQHALVVPASSRFQSVAALVARAKAAPGTLNYGSTGTGSASHLAMELFQKRTGTRLTHVPFRGAAPMTVEILAGRLDCAFATLPSVLSQIEAREIRSLALASPRAAPQLADLPLLSAVGIEDAEADAWLALFAPRATPAPIVAQLSSEVVAVMRTPSIAGAALKLGMVTDVKEMSAMSGFLATETRKWRDVVKRARLSPQ